MTESSRITLLLVDDHFVVRSGLAASLNLEPDLCIVAEAGSGEEALAKYDEVRPGLVLMDLQLPGINGIETTEQLLATAPGAKVLMFSTFARDDEVKMAMEAGAGGYLQKSAERSELLRAIHEVASGGIYLPPDLRSRLEDQQLGPGITAREREILQRIARGRANKEIASDLGIAEDTVKRHISNIFAKLGVVDRAQATAESIRRGIVRVGE